MRSRILTLATLAAVLLGCTQLATRDEPDNTQPTPPARVAVENAPAESKDERTGYLRVRHVGKKGVAAPSPGVFAEQEAAFDTEAYDHVVENAFRAVVTNPLSTFSIDVDTASYANVRRFLRGGALPPAGAVRVEEMINYFRYDYRGPAGPAPFSVTTEINECPWNPDHRLARIGLLGREIAAEDRPATNLVFLLDVSGSMGQPNKLPLLKRSMRLLTERLDDRDRVAIVVYAGAAGVVLPSTPGSDRAAILEALDRLEAGGSTAGGQGIRLAYDIARHNRVRGGVNRVVLGTDGDFNVGTTDQSELVRMIERQAKDGIFLSVLGFGMGNYKDSTLEKLADHGNGNYAYIDGIAEARKVLVEEAGSTLVTIAKDVKIQVEFNPAEVAAYRLIGYENRMLRAEDFNDDTKDAGEIGAGHTVTALYEIVPAGVELDIPGVDRLKYTRPASTSDAADTGEMMTVKVRWKQPEGDVSDKLAIAVVDQGAGPRFASEDFRFATAVAGFGMILRDSEYAGDWTLDDVRAQALAGVGDDRSGHRAGFVELLDLAEGAGLGAVDVSVVR